MREIGHGGMGSVYLGVRADDAFQKRVAVKILKRGMDTDSIVRRFRNERQILAALDHPNIASLLDGGTTGDGRPYFAMEYIEGQTIDEYCQSHRLGVSARIELFRSVCSAVQYAHQNLIIHRDIKPANVLVTAEGTPKLLDFGIAKLLNPELTGQTVAPTLAGLQLMTPEYASPEQVRGEPVTTATDVYSLGVMLYELLTEQRPYRLTSRAPSDVVRVVCESTPHRPSFAVTQGRDEQDTGDLASAERARHGQTQRLSRQLTGDIDNIVLKAMSKEPSRRYASADQLSEDLRRHLAGLTVSARKDTLSYRVGKFVRRNRATVAAGVLTVLALVAGIIGTAWQARTARAERQRAEQRFNDLRQLANIALFNLDDSIRDLPGSTPARKLLVSNALQYLDGLARDAADRADLRRELGDAYVKVGDVQGRPLNPNLGDTAGAEVSYRKAIAAYESLGASSPADAAVRHALATAYLRLSELLGRTGKQDEAVALAKKGLDLESATATDPAATPASRRALAVAYSRTGDLLSARGDTRGALEYQRKALAIMEALSGVAPDDQDNLRQLGVAYHKVGNSLGNPNYPNVGDFAGALTHMEQCVAVFRRATERYPTSAMFRRNLAVALSNAADILGALERTDESLARQYDAIAIFDEQAKADPTNAAARNDMAIGAFKIGGMMEHAGRLADAAREYRRALDIHSALAAEDPNNASFKAEAASDRVTLGSVQARLGDRAAALANQNAGVAALRELHQGTPGDIERHIAVAQSLMERGTAYALFARSERGGSGRPDLRAAERDYTEAAALLERAEKDAGLEGSDKQLLDTARKELATLRTEIGGAR